MKRLRGWAPALLWMGVIYAMSAMPGNTSGETSGRLTELAFKIISLL